MSRSIYRTKEGDTVDLICWRYYGSTADRITERVLEANLGLADEGAVLPSGVEIVLPDLTVASDDNGVRLWE